MWVFTQDGFISAVDNKVKPGLLAVRARDRQSLEALSEMAGSEIEFTPQRDYQYRTYVSRGILEDFMKLSIETLDYPNFKDRVYVSRGKQFARAAGNVWTSMHAVADKEYEDWHTETYSAKNSR
jgi:hypothetical protein